MQWYEGDIAQAVAISKSKNAIFVVYVEGKDDKSVNLTSLINNAEVSSKLESNTFVAIKVVAGSVSHNQFAAIYKNVPVPSLFFIGKNGKTLDIIVESSGVSDLSARINSVIKTHTGVLPVDSEQSTSTKLPEDIKNEIQGESSTPLEDIGDKLANVKCENGICLTGTDSPPSIESVNNELDSNKNEDFLEKEKQELSKEKKIQRAKELVDIQREVKKQEEEEIAKQKEIERRKNGQDVQKLRRWQQDQELKNMMEERQRAKNEEKAARDRILAQIAQDKADRAARFGTSPPAQPQSEVSPKPQVSSSANLNTARLQFKLPDGTSRTQNFDSSATLREVLIYVSTLNLPFKNYTLSTTFPRREFTADDLEITLRDLELCPNAVILVLPANPASAVVSSEGGGFVSLIWFLLSPILGIFEYFKNIIFGSSNNAPQPPDRNKRDNEEVVDQTQQAFKRKATEATIVRRQGNSNVHRLSDRTDSDEDNNTWNGNSTQQM